MARANSFGSTTAILLLIATISACSERPGGGEDPQDFYKTWTEHVSKADAGQIYDALDTALQHNLDMDIERTRGQMMQMPPDQRDKWLALKDLKGRDAYIKLMSLNRDTTAARLAKDYKILKVDTVIVMTVQHGAQDPILEYLRREKGSFRITEEPKAPVPVPSGHPPTGPDQPQLPAPADTGGSHPQGGGAVPPAPKK